MNLVQCNNGHFYDGDKFKACPHCEGNSKKNNVGEEKTVASNRTMESTAMVTEPLTVPGRLKSIEMIPEKKMQDTVSVTEKTVAHYYGEMEAEPVVGWLVCIEGSEFGQSFNLKSGKNFVGRLLSNDVVLVGDMAISREKHALIVYDPKSRRFLAQPGMSSELFYVNEEVVLQATALGNGDVIQIGNTKLRFVPLCDLNFSWDDYVKVEK